MIKQDCVPEVITDEVMRIRETTGMSINEILKKIVERLGPGLDFDEDIDTMAKDRICSEYENGVVIGGVEFDPLDILYNCLSHEEYDQVISEYRVIVQKDLVQLEEDGPLHTPEELKKVAWNLALEIKNRDVREVDECNTPSL